MVTDNGHAVRTSQKPRTAWLSRKGCAYEECFGNEHSSLCTLHTDLWFSSGLREERVEPLLLVKVPHFRFRELVWGEGDLLGAGWSMASPEERRKGPKD